MRCLRCFERIGRDKKNCDKCGYRNNKVERKTYWNRMPRLVALEITLKALVILVCAALFFVVAIHLGGARTAGFTLAAPVLLGAIFWLTVGKLTRHECYFRPVAFWVGLFGLTGAYCLLDRNTVAASAAVLLCALVHLAGRLGEGWKARLRRSSA